MLRIILFLESLHLSLPVNESQYFPWAIECRLDCDLLPTERETLELGPFIHVRLVTVSCNRTERVTPLFCILSYIVTERQSKRERRETETVRRLLDLH